MAAKLAALIGRGAQGEALAATLYREGVRTRRDLLRVLDRLPLEARTNVMYQPVRAIPLATAQSIAAVIARQHPQIIPVGGARRLKARLGDLDFLHVGEEEVLLRDTPTLRVLAAYASGPRRQSMVVEHRPRGAAPRNYRLDIFHCSRAEKPYALFHYTGSSRYNIRIRAYAKSHGWLLNQYGLFVAATGHRVRGSSAVKTEADLARLLGVTVRPPWERNF